MVTGYWLTTLASSVALACTCEKIKVEDRDRQGARALRQLPTILLVGILKTFLEVRGVLIS
jgi:hypothetical protein